MGEKKVPFVNRELSWLAFNLRVLEEAEKPSNPVMERLKFLSITASNLDEFYMVRVASLKEQIRSKVTAFDESGLSPTQLATRIRKTVQAFTVRQYRCYEEHILPDLERNGIRILCPEQLDETQYKAVSDYFYNVVFPVLTPIAVDRSRPFPLLANRALCIAVRLRKEGKSYFAVVQVPAVLPRQMEIPSHNGRTFILLEDIISYFLSALFELHIIEAHTTFRVTRNFDLEIDDDTEDLLIAIKKSLEKRKRGAAVRLELDRDCDEKLRSFLMDMLRVSEKDIIQTYGPIDLAGFMKFSMMPGCDRLRLPPVTPVPAADFVGVTDYFAAIAERDRLVHHPYESFDAVLGFLRQAVEDPATLAIKQTLYRVSGRSPVIEELIRAAQNGKQVTVLVELKARFDEENNILWAEKLEKAGCHVIYGVDGLKTHCKILLVVRKEGAGIRRYLHLGTGNYNDSTARLYTDIGMFTAREEFGRDASELFNRLTGYSRFPDYGRLVPAPEKLRDFLYGLIDNEIKNTEKGLPSGITMKVNSLLEHSRIFVFENGGNRKIYLGSADLMPRNLNRRVELLFPVEDAALKKRLLSMIELMLSDNQNARYQNKSGVYKRVQSGGRPINSQLELSRRAKAASTRKKRALEKKTAAGQASETGPDGKAAAL